MGHGGPLGPLFPLRLWAPATKGLSPHALSLECVLCTSIQPPRGLVGLTSLTAQSSQARCTVEVAPGNYSFGIVAGGTGVSAAGPADRSDSFWARVRRRRAT